MSALDELKRSNTLTEQPTTVQDIIDTETKEYGNIVDSVKDRIINNKKFRLFSEKIIVEVHNSSNEKDQELTERLQEIQDFNNMTELLMANENKLSLEGKSYIRAQKYDNMVLLTVANSGLHSSINNNNNLLEKVEIHLNIKSGNNNYLITEYYKDKEVERVFKQLLKKDNKIEGKEITAKEYEKETGNKVETKTKLDCKIPVVVFQNKATIYGTGEPDFGAKTEPYEKALQIA